MSNGVKYFVTFVLGAAAGSVAAWKLLESKYKQMAKEEIEEVREYYHQKNVETEGEPDTDHSKECTDVEKYQDIIKVYTEQEGGSTMAQEYIVPAPHVITPEEFAMDDDYQSESLTLYA